MLNSSPGRIALILAWACALAGCGSPPAASPPAAKKVAASPAPKKKGVAKPAIAPQPQPVKPPTSTPDARPLRQPGVLGDLLKTPEGAATNFHNSAPKPVIDDDQVAAHGIRKLSGKHLTLYTDLKSAPEVDELPRVFDLAVPQWQKYFEVPDKLVADWHVWGYLMQDKAKFVAAGLYPSDLPEIVNGYQRQHEFWLFEQPSAYYRRHLLLHEGTHAVMYHWLAGAGPPWYCEGMAELLGTHQWQDGKLTLAYSPRSREEVPEWGRVRMIKDAFAQQRALVLHEVLRLPPGALKHNDAYAWSWGAAAFFNEHPRYGDEFRKLRHNAKNVSVDFTKEFLAHFKDDVTTMQTEWQLFVANCEYGYDVKANALEVRAAQPLPAAGTKVEVSATRGWQSTGITLEKDKAYQLTAAGRYSLAQKPKTWWCEPGGVTVRYHRGQPLGMLVAAVRDDALPTSPDALLAPQPIGLAASYTPKISGTLWLKINEHDAEWADNEGTLSVNIAPMPQ